MIVVVMQPTYLPWLGYFDLMDNADVFVILDTVQFEKQCWQQRNKIKGSDGKGKWLSVPVVHALGQKILDVKIDTQDPWKRKHWGTIEQYYKRAPYWGKYSESLAAIYAQPWDSLCEFNLALIDLFRGHLEIETKMVRSSQLPVAGEKVGLLVSICHCLKADVYLSTVGSAVYIEENNIFSAEGISLQYHQYVHPAYKQMFGEFVPYMSALDLLFNEGPESLNIIRSGRRPSVPDLRKAEGKI